MRAKAGTPERFSHLCRRLIAANPREWRARVALARHLSSQGQLSPSLELLFEALEGEAEETATVAKRVMEAAATISVPLVVETGHGHSWAAAH